MHRLLRIAILVYLILIFLSTINCAYSAYIQRNNWIIGDWLINYQAGFIRRGFIGELIYQIAHFSSINPGLIVIFIQILFYGLFFLFSFLLLNKQKSLFPYLLLIFSPFLFTFQINGIAGGYRKEIIFFAILSFIIWYAIKGGKSNFEKYFYFVLLFFPLVILTHEMLALFLPYLLVVYFSVFNITIIRVIKLSLLVGLSIVTSIIIFENKQLPEERTKIIYQSLINENYEFKHGLDDRGAIYQLSEKSSYWRHRVKKAIKHNSYLYKYNFVLILSLVAFLPVLNKLYPLLLNKFSLFIFFVPILCTLPLFMFVLDWGRLIYIHLVSFFLLSFLNENSDFSLLNYLKNILNTKFNKVSFNSLKIIIIIPIILFYSSTWKIPHCCEIEVLNKDIREVQFIKITRHLQNLIAQIL